ncbi:MAG: hypothetical protein K2I18_06585 [Paramuribaculum sp.]|nr:hypothetical protein [Paramuribaculum sp.]
MKYLRHILFAAAVSCGFAAFAETPAKMSPGFTWGADVGGAIAMTGNDMSIINFDAAFGYRRGIVDFIGVGAGINMMVSNSNRSFPVYALFRSNFVTRPTLCFFEGRIGCAFTNVADNQSQTSLYVSPGVGFNLARSKHFGSYIVLSYVYNGMKSYTDSETTYDINGLHSACVRLGISF